MKDLFDQYQHPKNDYSYFFNPLCFSKQPDTNPCRKILHLVLVQKHNKGEEV